MVHRMRVCLSYNRDYARNYEYFMTSFCSGYGTWQYFNIIDFADATLFD